MNPTPCKESRRSLTIVVPVYNEEEVLPEFMGRLNAVVQKLSQGLEIKVLFINDGSTDNSPTLLDRECDGNKNASVVHFSRNFGVSAAHRAGLDIAAGDGALFIDADLQDPPEIIPEMLRKWNEGADVVIGRRKSRTETGLRGMGMNFFHSYYGKIAGRFVEPNTGIFGLIGKPVLDALKACPEMHLYLPGLRGWVGFQQEIVEYDRQERKAGETKQSLYKLFKYAWNALTSFGTFPLKAIMAFGCIICAVCLFCAATLATLRVLQVFGYFDNWKTPGFTTLAIAIFFLGGVQLVSLGILGEYIGRIYDECKRRPSYFIKKHRS